MKFFLATSINTTNSYWTQNKKRLFGYIKIAAVWDYVRNGWNMGKLCTVHADITTQGTWFTLSYYCQLWEIYKGKEHHPFHFGNIITTVIQEWIGMGVVWRSESTEPRVGSTSLIRNQYNNPSDEWWSSGS